MAEAICKSSAAQEAVLHQDYPVPLYEGMVVLDAVHYVQANYANDLAVRWNCKAGKCGSCSAEVNGKPRLMCMTRMDQFPAGADPRGAYAALSPDPGFSHRCVTQL